jgi:hypothetical protein
METVEANADKDLLRIEAEYRLAEYSFDRASEALTNFLRTHLGAVPPMVQMSHAVFVRVNELRLRDPQLRRLESAQRQSKMRRDVLLKERAELLRACGRIR